MVAFFGKRPFVIIMLNLVPSDAEEDDGDDILVSGSEKTIPCVP